jgi:hypothetical protein
MELINVLKCLCALMLPCFPKPHNVLWWEEITSRCISHTHTGIYIVYRVQLECSAVVFCLCSRDHLLWVFAGVWSPVRHQPLTQKRYRHTWLLYFSLERCCSLSPLGRFCYLLFARFVLCVVDVLHSYLNSPACVSVCGISFV